ncbi:hypothetical protein GCM10027610_096210 [Dactylosporangium cerinum]
MMWIRPSHPCSGSVFLSVILVPTCHSAPAHRTAQDLPSYPAWRDLRPSATAGHPPKVGDAGNLWVLPYD